MDFSTRGQFDRKLVCNCKQYTLGRRSQVMAVCVTEGCNGRPKAPETLCKKCKSKQNGASSSAEVHGNVIINEVIWYVDQHRHGAASDNVIRAVSCFFDTEDIEAAKSLLVSKYGEHIDAELKKSRKDSHLRSERMKLCEDIIGILEKLDDLADLIFVGRQWNKMPKCNPEELTDLCTAEKVAEFSDKFRAYEDAMSEIRAQISTLSEKVSSQHRSLLSDVVRHNDPVVVSDECNDPPRPGTSGTTGGRRSPKAQNPAPMRLNAAVGGQTEAVSLNSQEDSHSADSAAQSPNDGFVVQRGERRRLQREST